MWGEGASRRLLACGHDSSKTVVSNTKIKCITPVLRNSACGHSRWVTCYTINSEQIPGSSVNYQLEMTTTKCSELTNVFHPCQRHMYIGECHELLNPKSCGSTCDLPLPCGHSCSFFCHETIQERREAVDESKTNKGASVSVGEEKSKENVQGIYCPPCVRVIKEKLSCGHEVDVPCLNKEDFVAEYVCNQTCDKKLLCRHKCVKKCGEPCNPCQIIVKKRRPGVCPHDVYTECSEDAYDFLCPELVLAFPPSTCGHKVLVPCGKGRGRNFKSNRELLQICDAPCDSMLSCGHDCSGICCQCLQGRFHVRCNKPCDNILLCGHKCRALCSAPCPPCQEECGSVCVHQKCNLPCGEICDDCREPCDLICSHGACTKFCFEICNKEPCYERCMELIPSCRHFCVGFCGEPCPPYCFVCSKDKLAEGNLFGDPPVETDRYIFLPECGHVIESNSMDGWMESKRDEEEITPIFCPLCRTIIRQLKRYSSLMFINRNDILRIMSTTNGFENENRMYRITLLEKIHLNEDTNFKSTRTFLLEFLTDKNNVILLKFV